MRIALSVVSLAVIASLTGCAGDRLDSSDQGSGPQRLEAQPVGRVDSGQLPDPSTDTAQFPQKPVVDPALGSQQVNAGPPASAMDVKKETMVGSWKVNAGGANCDMFLTLTNLGSGSRGGTRGCTGTLQIMGSWEVSGKQVTLKDRDGNTLATLYKTAENRFDGSLSAGQPLSLSR